MFLLLLTACTSSSTPCGEGVEQLETSRGAITCDLARAPTRYLRILSGRPLPPGTTATGITAVKKRFEADPDGTRSWLSAITQSGRAIESAHGVDASEKRARAMYDAIAGAGPVSTADEDLGTTVSEVLSVRARDDEEKLALNETDIEAWITYASLCHEAQGSGVLRLSVANKVDIYAMVEQRFTHGDRAEMIALASFGPVWPDVVDRWKAASYDKQQAWIRTAPLPASATASSLGYFEAVIEGDVVTAAASIHDHFGPLHFRDGPGYFTGSD